jgi:glycosyltransferase involved in cell wall biosynthesis
VPEVVQHGVSGYLVANQAEAIEAARDAGKIDRRKCRAVYEERFTALRMADAYLGVYDQLCSGRRGR